MKKDIAIYGYFCLLMGGVLLDYPIVALLAIPIFLVGFILLLYFYHELNTGQKAEKLINSIKIFCGTTLLCGTLGYSAFNYFQFHAEANFNEQQINWVIVLLVLLLNCEASLLIFSGIRKSKKLNRTEFHFVWLPTIFIIPITLITIRILF